MSTDTTSQSVVPPIAVSLEALKAFAQERSCYRRELPRLLAEGQSGRCALIKGDAILSIWDTWADANQAGLDRFGLDEPFCVQKIDAHDEERFALIDAWQAAQCRP